MSEALRDSLIQLNADTIQYVRKLYDLDDPKKMEEAIGILEEWVKKQNHFLKRDFPRRYLETIIIANKGSLERAKSRLDKLCTLKTILPHFYAYKDIREDFKSFYACMRFVPLPKLTDSHYRIIALKPTPNEYFHKTPFLQHFMFYLIFSEYLKKYDYANGVIFIADYRDINVMDIVTRLNPVEVKQMVTLIVDGYATRLQALHVINSSLAAETLMKVTRPLFSAKVAERFQLHSSMEPVYDIISKDILPQEFGGNYRSLKDIQDDWINLLTTKESMEYLDWARAALVNESYRLTSSFNEHLGLEGTFRSLNVD